MDIFVVALLAIVCAFVGAWIGEMKGHRSAGFALGLFLGPIGILIACCLPAEKPKRLCYKCKNKVDSASPFCPLCGTDLRIDVTVDCPYCKKTFSV